MDADWYSPQRNLVAAGLVVTDALDLSGGFYYPGSGTSGAGATTQSVGTDSQRRVACGRTVSVCGDCLDDPAIVSPVAVPRRLV